uniref:Uncharacterized protein n=1 Tax=Amblyomma triste TaxID=251400 RepID=A0A023G1Y0_AMBTT
MKGAAFSAVQLPITMFLLIHSWYPHQANGQHCQSPVCYFVNGDDDCGPGCLCYSNPETPNDEVKGVCAGNYEQQPAQQHYGTMQGTGYGYIGGSGPSYGPMGQGGMGEGIFNSLGNGLSGVGQHSQIQWASPGPSPLQTQPGATGSGPVSTAKAPDVASKPGSPPSKPPTTPSKPGSPSPAPVKATSLSPTSATPPSGISKPLPLPASKPKPLPQLRLRPHSQPRLVSRPRPRIRRG